jgi:hypothetical protein
MVIAYLLVALLLLLLNGFFVLAEFAAVKMRPSRVEELVDDGVANAKSVKHIQEYLDEYLSVCQLGITFASIGLGFVAEPAVVRLVEPVIDWLGIFSHDSHARFLSAHGIAFTLSYLLVSFLHILVGGAGAKIDCDSLDGTRFALDSETDDRVSVSLLFTAEISQLVSRNCFAFDWNSGNQERIRFIAKTNCGFY